MKLLPNVTDEWEKDFKDLLYNFDNMYNPDVMHEPESDYPYKMWFFGWAVTTCNPGFPGCDAIFAARSKDLSVWEVYCGKDEWDTTMTPNKWEPVLTADDKFYDDWHVGDPSVVKCDGHYYMAYSSLGFDQDRLPADHPEDTDGFLSVVMGASSADGLHWTRTEKPLLMWEPEIGKHEAWMKNFNPDDYEDGKFYGNFHRPSLMFDEGKWKLWFDYMAGDQFFSVGYAENTTGDFMDTAQWQIVQAEDKPVLRNWPNPDVIKVDDQYYMYGDPRVVGHGADPKQVPSEGWAARQICEAVSDDGLNWTVTGWIAPDPGYEATQVPEATVLEMDGQRYIYLFYATQLGGDPYDYRQDRIRCMRKKI